MSSVYEGGAKRPTPLSVDVARTTREQPSPSPPMSPCGVDSKYAPASPVGIDSRYAPAFARAHAASTRDARMSEYVGHGGPFYAPVSGQGGLEAMRMRMLPTQDIIYDQRFTSGREVLTDERGSRFVGQHSRHQEPSQVDQGYSMRQDYDETDSADEDDEDEADAAPGTDTSAGPSVEFPKPFNKKNLKRHSETRFLLNQFGQNPHPDATQRAILAKQIRGLSARQIQVWFQNRRAKLKRMSAADADRMLSTRSYPDGYGPEGFANSPSIAPRPERQAAGKANSSSVVESVYSAPVSDAADRATYTTRNSAVLIPPYAVQDDEHAPRRRQSVNSSASYLPQSSYIAGHAIPHHYHDVYESQTVPGHNPLPIYYGRRSIPGPTTPTAYAQSYGRLASGHSYGSTWPSSRAVFQDSLPRSMPVDDVHTSYYRPQSHMQAMSDDGALRDAHVAQLHRQAQQNLPAAVDGYYEDATTNQSRQGQNDVYYSPAMDYEHLSAYDTRYYPMPRLAAAEEDAKPLQRDPDANGHDVTRSPTLRAPGHATDLHRYYSSDEGTDAEPCRDEEDRSAHHGSVESATEGHKVEEEADHESDREGESSRGRCGSGVPSAGS